MMTGRFIKYFAVFNLLAAGASAQGIGTVLDLSWAQESFGLLWIASAPPVWTAFRIMQLLGARTIPGALPIPLWITTILLCCVLYYGALFVVFLPASRRRGPELALPPGLRKPWKIFATVVVVLHVLWAVAASMHRP